MATNVSFLKGTQSNFNQLTAFQAGAFYLTTDTNRLYFADSATEANYLNKYVHTVASEALLKSAITDGIVVDGDFAYVSGINALVAIKGNSYVQINAYTDTDDDTTVTGLTFTKSTDAANDTITFTYTLKQSTENIEGKKTALNDITGTFQIAGSDINAIIPASAVSVGATVSGSTATVKTSGQGSAGSGFTVTGAGSVTVGGQANALTITGVDTTYEMSSAGTAIKLNGTDGGEHTVTISGGTQIDAAAGEANEIVINHSEITTTGTTSAVQPADNTDFTVIDSITTDNGHITGYNTKTVTIPKAPEYVITDITGGTDGVVSITLKDETSGASETYKSDADFFVTVGKSKTKKFIGNDLNVYTIDEVDDIVRDINAMVYRGTVGGTSATVSTLPTANVQKGDTYMVASAGNYGGHVCGIGDLLIATGTENDNGILSSITWTYVPSANDTDTQYDLVAAAGSDADSATITLKTTNGVDGDSNISLKAGNDIDVSVSGSAITVAHEAFTAKPKAATGITLNHKATNDKNTVGSATGNTFTAITGLTADNGHVTEYTTTTFTLPTDYDTTYALSGASNKITLTGADGSTDDITVAGGTDISATVSGNKLTVTHNTHAGTKKTATGDAMYHKSTFSAITGLTLSNGHINDYTVTTFTLPDGDWTLSGTADAVSNNVATFTSTLSGPNGASSTSALKLTSSNLTLSKESDTVEINLVWGSFNNA